MGSGIKLGSGIKRCSSPLVLACFCAALGGGASAAPSSSLSSLPETSPAKAATKASAYEAVRAALFAHLEEQTGAKSEIPAFPTQNWEAWLDGRQSAVAKGAKARYALVFEHLLTAQKLLQSSDEAERKQGLWIASETANFAAYQLPKDKWLVARLYEGLLLPNVNLANVPRSQFPSRQDTLEAAVAAFAQAGETDKELAVLEWLLSIAQKPQTNPKALTLNLNTRDWVRGTLAALLFQRPGATIQDLERALTLLQAIESPEMKDFQGLKERVQAQLRKIKSQP